MEGQDSSDVAVNSEEKGCTENDPAVNQMEGEKHSLVNGLSNGYDKVKKDKERHKDKDRDKDRHKDREGDKHRNKDDKDKHRDKHKSEHKDKDRDKDKHRDKERDKSKHSSSSSSKDKHSSSSSSKDKDRDKDKERRDKEKIKNHDDKERKDKDKEHKSSSSSSKDKSEHKSSSSSKHSISSSSKPSSGSLSKDKEHRDKDKERDKEKDKHRDKDKDKERSKEKHSSSSSKDKERHSSDKHKSDKDRHSSSSKDKDKDKDRHSSDKKDRDKHRDKDRSKEMDTSKEKEIKKESPQIEQEIPEIKQEFKEDYENYSFQNHVKEESLDDDYGGKLMIKEEPTDDEESRFDTTVKTEPKTDVEDEDDMPMAARIQKIKNKRQLDSEDEDNVPLSARKKPKKESAKKRKRVDSDYEDEEEDFKPAKKAKIKEVKKDKKADKSKGSITESPKKKKKEEEQEVWKWWEEEKKPDGVKWTFLEHKGPVFAPLYERLPSKVKFYYDGEEMELSEKAEEVATFYARMLEHDYTTMDAFNKNFMNDWRSVMTSKERERIKDLSKCDFKRMHAYFIQKTEERKAMSKEEKKKIKEENEKLIEEYGFCMIDGHKEKIGNFKIEPPGLFRGRGMHPKMGKLKKRVTAEEIIINCSKGSKVPKAPEGHRWKEVRHDNTVTWLASWVENVQSQVKYVMLNPSSKLKGEKDWQKYEMARKLAKSIDKIREDYIADFKSKEMRIRQRAVAMYFIDKLALRAGNEKDEDQADTVGCCSLRVEHIALHPTKDGKECVVVFDFLGKDSIRYYNEVPVEKRVFKNLTLFMENKKGEDDLFDRLNTSVLNKHLSDLMDGLTAKVFRTYNASITLQNQLKELTEADTSIAEKLLAYNRANRAVAVLCNHQRAVPKTHDKSMASLREKLEKKRDTVEEAERAYKNAKRDAKHGSAKERIAADKAKKTLERLREQLLKLEVQETDKEENKTIALGTSKLNYLDPRISVAWCKKHDVPVEKVYNKTQRDKFRWAIDMATADYIF